MRLRSGLYVNIILVAFSLFILLPLAYCVIPWTSVVSMEISVQDQDGYPLSGAEASFLDAKGKAIGKIAGKAWVGGEQHVTWWTSSHYPDKSFMRPQDALSAKVAMISAPDRATYATAAAAAAQGRTRRYHGLEFRYDPPVAAQLFMRP